MSSQEKSGSFNIGNAHELVRQARKLIQEDRLPKALAAYQTAINEYKQYLISLKYIEEDISQTVQELQRTVQRIKNNLAGAPPKETPAEKKADRPEEKKAETAEQKIAGEREARRIIYQAKKTVDDLMAEVKKGLAFSILKKRVEETYRNFKNQLVEVFGPDTETIKIYLRWLDNLVNDLQKIILERKTSEIKEEKTPPAKKEASVETPRTPAAAPDTGQPAVAKIGAGYKVLVVDDEPDVIMTLEFLLVTEGFTVFKANNGEDGIKLALEKLPDLMIFDIKMPGISGYEAAHTLKDDPRLKNTPLIFLTAVSQVVDPTYGIKTEAIADRYVSKPYDIDDFLEIIKELLKIK